MSTFDAYRVAVKLELINTVSSSLAAIGMAFQRVQAQTNSAQASLGKYNQQAQTLKATLLDIQRLGIVGGLAAGAGFGVLSALGAPLGAARNYELAYARFKTLNLGELINTQADQFSRGAKVFGVSNTQLMDTLSESYALFNDFGLAKKLAPTIAELNKANSLLFSGKIDQIDGGAARAIAKFIDRRGGNSDEASFMRNLDLAQKIVTGSGGAIKFRDLDMFSQYGGTAFRGLSDEGLLKMSGLMQEQGGARAATALMSAYQNLVAGRTPNATKMRLQDFGLAELEWQTHSLNGGKPLKNLVVKGLLGSELMQSSPVDWYRTVFLPALARKGITDEAGILKTTNDLLSARTGSGQASIITTQMLQVLRDYDVTKNAAGVRQTIGLARGTLGGAQGDMHARWRDVMTELGTTILPLATAGVRKLTIVLQMAIDFMHEFPGLTKGLVVATAAIGAFAAVAGTLMLATAAFNGLGLALAVGGGIGPMLAAAAGGISSIGGALLKLMPWVAAAAGALYVGYKAGEWITGKIEGGSISNAIGAGVAGLMSPFSEEARDAARINGGGKAWFQAGPALNSQEGSKFVSPGGAGGNQAINNTIVMPNGEVLAKVVTNVQERGAQRSVLSGAGSFDSSMGFAAASMGAR